MGRHRPARWRTLPRHVLFVRPAVRLGSRSSLLALSPFAWPVAALDIRMKRRGPARGLLAVAQYHTDTNRRCRWHADRWDFVYRPRTRDELVSFARWFWRGCHHCPASRIGSAESSLACRGRSFGGYGTALQSGSWR